MPFTLSHAVLAPPIAKLTGQRLPIAALAIGCMTPDLYRILMKTEIHLNHQFKGILYPDLLVGLLLCLLWYLLYRPVIYACLSMKDELNISSFSTFFKFLFVAIIAIIIGTTTHIVWDGLTHDDFRTLAFRGFLERSVSILQHPYPMHRVLQIASSAIALPFILWMTLDYYFKHKQNIEIPQYIKNSGFILLISTIVIGCIYYIYIAKHTGFIPVSNSLYDVFGFFFKYFTQGAMVFFTFGCLIFRLLLIKKM